MNLGYVALGFGLLLSVGIAFPGLLLVLAQLMPPMVGRIAERLHQTPRRCFGVGIAVGAVLFPTLIGATQLIPSSVQLIGWLLVLIVLMGISIGAAGLALLVGRRMVGSAASEPRALIYGAVAIELAVVLPFLGWFVLAPLLTIWVLGATWLAWREQPVAPSTFIEEASHAIHAP